MVHTKAINCIQKLCCSDAILQFLSSGGGASTIAFLVSRSVCQKKIKLSKRIKQRDFNIELGTKIFSQIE